MALIQTIDDLRLIIPTVVGKDIDRYTVYLDNADVWIKREITGATLFPAAGPVDADLSKYLKRVEALKGYYDAIPFLDVIETEFGFGIVSNGNISPASKERVESLRKQTYQQLSDACESLFIFLEENSTYHADWKASKAYSLVSNCFIKSLTDFVKYAPFPGNRFDFVKLIPVIRKIQKLVIEPAISTEYMTELINQLNNSSLTEINDKNVESLRYALAFMVITDRQYRVLFNDSPYLLKAAESIDKDVTGQSLLVEVVNTLKAAPDNYPAFRDSSTYALILANAAIVPGNDANFFTAI